MTELDQFAPDAEPIHPYDVYDMLCDFLSNGGATVQVIKESPRAVDDADYDRNRHKVGDIIAVNGKRYFQTTSVPYKSTSFIAQLAENRHVQEKLAEAGLQFNVLPPPRETADKPPACPV